MASTSPAAKTALLTGMWTKRHHLNKMTLRDLVTAYFQHYAVIVYLLLAVAGTVATVLYPPSLLAGAAAAAFAVVAYPLVWYTLHRFVLHGTWMFKSPLTARTWKRIHYDHHQDPHHLEILFGALHTTLPTIVLATMPAGYLIGGLGGAATALVAGLLTTCFYEFCHCVQHLSFKPKWRWLAEVKARHMAHHFHDETGNFGITNFAWDKILGTFYERDARPAKSLTVFNLGYTPEVADTYPWVRRLSAGLVAMSHPRERRRAAMTEMSDAA